MRMRVWLFVFGVAALFMMSAPERAYAHAQHHAGHHHAQSASIAVAEADAEARAEAALFSQAVFASTDAAKCPHGHPQADCGFCCAAVAGAAMLVPSALQSWQRGARSEQADPSVSFAVRQPVLDLSRPPKSFA